MIDLTTPKVWLKIIVFFLTLVLVGTLTVALEAYAFWLAKFMADNNLGIKF